MPNDSSNNEIVVEAESIEEAVEKVQDMISGTGPGSN